MSEYVHGRLPQGYGPAPPWSLERETIAIDGRDRALRRVADRTLWLAAIDSGSVSWRHGWQAYWAAAAEKYGDGGEWRPDSTATETGLFFADGTQRSFGIRFPHAETAPGRGAVATSVAQTGEQMRAMVGDADIEVGLIGVVARAPGAGTRPALTIIVSGGEDAGAIGLRIHRAFTAAGIGGVLVRSAGDGSFAIVKLLFMPEWYLQLEGATAGVNWPLWAEYARREPDVEIGAATLLWCDSVTKAFLNVRDAGEFPIREVYFDAYNALALPLAGHRNLGGLERPDTLAKLVFRPLVHHVRTRLRYWRKTSRAGARAR